MNYDFSELKQNIEDTKNWLKKEYAGVRAGKANPTILDGVQVELYGSMIPINHAATITNEDARTIKVTPWDQSQLKNIEKAIVDANLDVSVSDDGKSVRLSFPELTTERREKLIKVVKNKLEDAKVGLRQHRDETWSDIQQKYQNSEISEDDKYNFKEEIEKIVSKEQEELEEIEKKKEEEIRS